MKVATIFGVLLVLLVIIYSLYVASIERHNATIFFAPVANFKVFITAQNLFFEKDLDLNGIKDYALNLETLQKNGLIQGFSESGIKGVNTSWLAGGPYQLYQYRIFIPGGANQKEAWACEAHPIEDPSDRYYYVDQTGIIRVEHGKVANSSSAAIEK